ncbi:MAG: HAD-IA family hydrolase [Thermomicrobiales bacterium]
MAGRISVVSLDMGDTLVRLASSLNAAYHRAVEASGGRLDEDHLARSLAEVVRETDERNRHEGFLPDEATDRLLWRDFNSRLLQRLEVAEHLWDAAHDEIERSFIDPANFDIFPEVHDALGELREAGYRLAICSNWSWHLDTLCDRLDLARYFELMVISARVGYSKPHPAIFHHELDALNVRPEEVVHVGDNPIADVGGALAVGIRPVLLDRTGRDAGVEVPHRIASLSELPALLRTFA